MILLLDPWSGLCEATDLRFSLAQSPRAITESRSGGPSSLLRVPCECDSVESDLEYGFRPYPRRRLEETCTLYFEEEDLNNGGGCASRPPNQALASGVVITEENGKTEVYGSENCEIDKASEIGLNKKGTEVAGSVPFVKASLDGDLVGTASAHPVASISKAEGEDSKAVSDVELEVMNGSESSEEGPEPYGTELADEVTCSVYGSNDHEYLYENVNCRELDVLDVNSDRPVKVKLVELFVEENKEKQTEHYLAIDGFVGKISGPRKSDSLGCWKY
ncbi:hypothetical protein U1Q18_045258 [Sarracenia purpurea var. burkii]